MLDPKVIYEDKGFLVLNKPAGMLVHESRIMKHETLSLKRESRKDVQDSRSAIHDSKGQTLVDWLIKNYPEVKKVGDDPEERPGIVHRLDKATSGIMIIPRSQEYFLYLKSLFQEHKIQKTYLALVFGKFKEKRGVINKPIGIKSGTTKRSIHSTKMLKTAVTKYEVLKTVRSEKVDVGSGENELSLIRVMPETGRTHQIRVHLSSIGHPVVGDGIYLKSKKLDVGSKMLGVKRLMLHALSLEFSSREREKLKFEAEVPEDFTLPTF